MEDAGRVRRGYFVEGLGGSQFALPGAVDRLRIGEGGDGVVTLAATDPANPYGATISWPAHEGRPSRSAGAFVVLVDGALTAFVERGGRSVLTFSDTALAATATAMRDLSRGAIRRMVVATVDGQPAGDTALGRALLESGFSLSYKGLTSTAR
jgi:ATP-dependent Lhr-like helicase